MESNLTNACLLLLIGMFAVFFILFLVVTGGNLLIRLVNTVQLDTEVIPFADIKNQDINSLNEEAVVKAVSILTAGAGRVESIKKL